MEYRVKALSVGGLGNKVFRAGDTVTEADFPKDRWKEILKGNFLEPMNGDREPDFQEAKAPDEQPFDITKAFTTSEKKEIENITLPELKTYLESKGVEYNKRASKGD